jgi:hypothetical protein
MFLAQPTPALSAAQELLDILPEPVVRFLPEMFESFVSMKIHVLIRFGKWEDILCEVFPDDAELYSYTTAMLRYARTVALANLGKITEASAEKELFLAAKKSVQEDRAVFNNPCSEILLVAEQMMLGELAYKAGHTNKGLEHLRKSVQLDDELLYDEPWGWMQPTRHALGALLIDSEFFYEAEAVYRADLGLDNSLPRPSQHPRNVWSLHGLNECLEHRGENLERQLIRQLLDQALARAEIAIKASCYCRSEKK